MTPNILRVLDANANRAREALRVMEDAARFLLDHPPLTRSLKQLRHDLAAALKSLPPHLKLETSRDTPGDVGVRISTPAEKSRADVEAVVTAAGKRLSESLRTLEEFGKLIDPRFAAAVEQLRYRGYTLEKNLHAALPPALRTFRGWKLCVILTEAFCTHHPWLEVARAALDGGADCLQLREKHLTDGELLRRAERLVHLAARHQTDVIINDRPDIALLSGARGVHVGEHDLPPQRVRDLAGHRLLIGASTHHRAEAAAAARAGVDYVGVGAIYPTATKQRTPSGLKYLRAFIKHHAAHFRGHLAIGGITPDNLAPVLKAGARGIAVSSIICSAKNPAKITRTLRRAMK